MQISIMATVPAATVDGVRGVSWRCLCRTVSGASALMSLFCAGSIDGLHPAAVADLATLNRLFVAWVETVYHPRIHSSTGAAPLSRWRDGLTHPVALPTPARLREAFLLVDSLQKQEGAGA